MCLQRVVAFGNAVILPPCGIHSGGFFIYLLRQLGIRVLLTSLAGEGEFPDM